VRKSTFIKTAAVPVLVGAAALEGRREEGVAFVLDLTERKRAEYLARQVFENSPDRISIVGPDYRFKRVNPAFERRWGMPPDTFIGKHGPSFWDGKALSRRPRRISTAVSRRGSRLRRVVQPIFWPTLPLVTYSPLRPTSERVEAVLAIGRDLTEHVLASEALREAQMELAHVTRVTTLAS